MCQTNPASDRIERRAPDEAFVPAWYVEVLAKKGWQPLRRIAGQISYYTSYEEAVAGAVEEWQRSDRPARPAPATLHEATAATPTSRP
jgi:hypothetical protein